ncbi:MAG: amidase [Actinomycetota bacterium]|jgi:amidase
MDALWRRSAVELAAAMRTREVSAREVLGAHLARIAETNPAINAIVTLEPERALAQAGAADEAMARGEPVGPLHGLPIAHKDLADTAGVRTTYGSPIYADHVPERDEPFVVRVREAGAVMLGKTNTPEFGAGSHTFNAVFGPTRNPHDLSKSAGGSSGGAAAALASGMVPIADGSDLGGSLRNPASFCGVVGFRPSVGLVPSWPEADPEDLSVDGPMARTVEDAALLLSVMADRADLAPDLAVVASQAADLDGLRVAWAPACAATMPIDPEIVAVVDAARPRFEAIGCRIEPAYPDLTGAREVFVTLRAQSFAAEYGPLLAQHRNRMKDTVVWNIELGLALTDDDVARAHALAADIHRRAAVFFETFDVLVQPVTQVAPFPIEIEYPTEVAGVAMATYIDWMESCWSITVLGGPAISVPCGRTATGLPVGTQIVGRRGDDAAVLRLARAFEQTGPPAAIAPFAG